jgi:drug/metabolite transporter (DMT)-like permease
MHDLRTSDMVLLGGVLVLGSAVLYAGYQVSAGQMIRRLGAVRFAAYASIVSTLAIGLHCLATTGFGPMLRQPASVWTLSAWMAIVSTVLPVVMMAEGIRRVGSSNAAMMSSIGPIATIFMGEAFLGEPITAVQLAGATLVTSGVLAISLKPTAPKKPEK